MFDWLIFIINLSNFGKNYIKMQKNVSDMIKENNAM